MIRQQNVFIVSGDARVRSDIRHALEAPGLNTVEFETGAAYRGGPRSDVPACLILDVVLPDMCGLGLHQELAGKCPPVLFVSRHPDIALSVRAMKTGALDFLMIPFCPNLLLSAVRAAIELDVSTRAQRERMEGFRERHERLTPRERQVMCLVVSGLLNKQVASELGISEVTVEIHRGRVMQKMGAASFAGLVRMAECLRIAFGASSRSNGGASLVNRVDVLRPSRIVLEERQLQMR
jgi:FixJ family two-component response regulator